MRLFKLMVIFISYFFMTSAYAEDFTLTTTAFLDAGILPVLYTCDGKDISPQFAWTNSPEKTQSYAMILSDPEAPEGTFYHWILYNIPKETQELPEGITNLPTGSMQAKNSWGKAQYNGPCPPKGTSHTYVFTLYALDKKITLPANGEGSAIVAAIKEHALKETKLTAVYSRWLK